MRLGILLLLILAGATRPSAQEPNVRPLPDQARLVVVGREHPAERVMPAGKRWSAGPVTLYATEPGDLVCENPEDGSIAWRVPSTPGTRFEILAVGKTRACIRTWRREYMGSFDRVWPAEPMHLDIVDLSAGDPTTPVEISPPHGTVPAGRRGVVELWDVTADGDVFFCLSVHRTEVLPISERRLLGVRVTALDGVGPTVLWEKDLVPSALAPAADHFLRNTLPGRYGSTFIRPLTVAGPVLLVCSGSQQPLIALDLRTGEERWRLDALWEFERGYDSDAPASIILTRFGRDPDNFRRDMLRGDERRKERAEADERRRQELLRTSSLLAGPVWVPGETGKRIFVAVARGDRNWYPWTAACDVYEIDDAGNPVGLLRLPRPVRQDACRVHDGGITWGLCGGGLARILPTQRLPFVGRDPARDHAGRLAWYRETRTAEEFAERSGREGPWLSAGISLEDPIALDERIALFVAGRGWIETEGDLLYHFPLDALDIISGERIPLRLDVPLQAPLTPPTDNGTTWRDAGGARYRTHGAYGLRVSGLERMGRRIDVEISDALRNAWRIRFASVLEAR